MISLQKGVSLMYLVCSPGLRLVEELQLSVVDWEKDEKICVDRKRDNKVYFLLTQTKEN